MPDPFVARIFFHYRCFDGAASAAIFSRFYRERMNAQAEFRFTGMTHRAAHPFEEHMFEAAKTPLWISSIRVLRGLPGGLTTIKVRF